MDAVESNPNILGGMPCFAGTRVPVESLFEYLRGGYSVSEFLEQFPTVKREQIEAVLKSSTSERPSHPAA